MKSLESKLANLCFAGGAVVGIAGALIAGGLSIYDARLGKEIGTQIVHRGSYVMIGLLCAGSYFGSKSARSIDLSKEKKD